MSRLIRDFRKGSIEDSFFYFLYSLKRVEDLRDCFFGIIFSENYTLSGGHPNLFYLVLISLSFFEGEGN
jgi:hypothetical protein